MDIAAFRDSPVGVLVPISGHDARLQRGYEHVAFIPEPLGQPVALSDQTWSVVVDAMSALGRLDQAAHQVPNPALFRRPSLSKEAVSTSALEGTHAALADVLEADLEGQARTPEVQEVRNYIRTAEHAYSALGERGLTVGLLCDLQGILVGGTRDEGPDTGRVRTSQVVIGPKGCAVTEARFVPPPPGDQLRAGLDAWEAWVSADHPAMPAAVQAALAHYQFEALHPFHEGNGRLGRLAVVLQLMSLGELREPLLALSPWFEARRREYQDALRDVSVTGDFDAWVRFFATGLGARCRETVQTIEQLLNYQQRVRQRIRQIPLRGTAALVAEDLIARPVLRPTSVAKYYGVSYVAANAAVTRLHEHGLLEETTGRSYDRLFAAREVLRIIER